jgi:phage terminase large subunit GpA-like protein
MNAKGIYLAPNQRFSDGEIIGDLEKNETASFWISGLCSPWRSYEKAATRYVKAIRSGKSERIQAAVNTVFGEGYQVKGDAPTWQAVKELCEQYEHGTLPENTTVLTCGVDVHKDDLHYVIRAWGYKGEAWTVEKGIIYGNTDCFDVWDSLAEQVLEHEWEVEKGYFKIRMMAIDSGYRPYMVYLFTKKHLGITIAAKGRDSETVTAPVRVSKIEYNYKGKAIPGGIRLFVFDDGYFKSQLHSKVSRKGEGANTWHLPIDITEDFCRQIVAEEKVTTKSGREMWVKTSKQNHFLDCEKLNEVSGEVLRVTKLKPKAGSNKTKVLSKGIE